MNNDLISREALKDKVALMWGDNNHITESMYEIIDNAPTVEPETKVVANVTFDKEQMEELVEKAKADILAQIARPQGEWKFVKHGYYECSECEHLSYEIKSNFCPNCGARMGGTT